MASTQSIEARKAHIADRQGTPYVRIIAVVSVVSHHKYVPFGNNKLLQDVLWTFLRSLHTDAC